MFKILIENAKLYYNTQLLTNTFQMGIDIKNLVGTPIVEEVPFKELDKSLQLDLYVNENLKLALTQ